MGFVSFYIILLVMFIAFVIFRSDAPSWQKIFWLIVLTGVVLWFEKPDWLVRLLWQVGVTF